MTRLHLILTIACVTGAAATVAPTSPERRSLTAPAGPVAPGMAKHATAHGPADIAWLARYGTYNVRRGTWNFLPSPDGC
jgi:hypothetical protein